MCMASLLYAFVIGAEDVMLLQESSVLVEKHHRKMSACCRRPTSGATLRLMGEGLGVCFQLADWRDRKGKCPW